MQKCHEVPLWDAQAFKAYVKMVLTRKNTITGVMYSEDPGNPLSSSQHCLCTYSCLHLASPAHTKHDWVCTVGLMPMGQAGPFTSYKCARNVFQGVGVAVVLEVELTNEPHATNNHRVWGWGHCTLSSIPDAQGASQ